MNVEIKNKQHHIKGVIYTIEVHNQNIRILFLFHSIERISKWKLSDAQVLDTLIYPEEVLRGHSKRFIAHKRFNHHLIRAIYQYENDLPVLITVYFPYSKRYFQGKNNYEDKIFKRG